ncbi:MAG TPA: hypothetical protein VKE51_07915 [Vicinamibacterales bacterium]|nr:hypothetical protein [Vicinamibacterales bacterium]
MNTRISVAELRARGVVLQPHEAVVIAQRVIQPTKPFVVRESDGPPSLENVLLNADGSVACARSASTPSISEIGTLLRELLSGTTRVPGGLHYAIGRALLEVEGPPFDSIEAFSRSLARFEQGERDEVLRHLLERFNDAARASCGAPLARPRSMPNRRERRTSGQRVDELRRQLRDADARMFDQINRRSRQLDSASADPLARFERLPVVPPSSASERAFWSAPAIAAAVAAIALIAASAVARVGLESWPLSSVARLTPRPASAPMSTTNSANAPRDALPSRTFTLDAPLQHASIEDPSPQKTAAMTSGSTAPIANAVARLAVEREANVVRAPRPVDVAGLRLPDVKAASDDTSEADEPNSLVRAVDANNRPVFSDAFVSRSAAVVALTSPSADEDRLRIMTIGDADGAHNYHVRLSPDGRMVTYDSDRDGAQGIYVADRDGSHVRRISGSGYAVMPMWAPDARQIAFLRAEPDDATVWNLWVVALDGGGMRRLTQYHDGQLWSGSWFPDGQRLCYSHNGRLVVFDLRTNSSRAYETPVKGRPIREPVVSPDGANIVFQVLRNGGWLLDLRNASMRRVIDDPTVEAFAWSPDGRRIVYHSRRDGQWNVFRMLETSTED